MYRLDAVLGERPAGGTILASVGADGVLLVDSTGSPVLAEKLLVALEELGASGVDMLITTHPHPDHVGGNELLAAGGATVIGHARTGYWMSRPIRPMWFLRAVPPYPREARPTRLLQQTETLSFNGETVRLLPVGPAHTDGDLVVHFVDSGVAHVGDLFNGRGRYSTASWINCGEIRGLALALAKLSLELPPETRIVGGHSPIGSWAALADLESYSELLVQVTNRVDSGLRAGADDEALVASAETLHRDWFSHGEPATAMHGNPAGWVGNIAESLRRAQSCAESAVATASCRAAPRRERRLRSAGVSLQLGADTEAGQR